MFYIVHIFIKSALGLIPVLPGMALLHFVLLRLDKKRKQRTPVSHILTAYLFCFVLLSIFSATDIASAGLGNLEVRLNLIPFDLIHTNTIQYIQNVLLFVPLGFLLPVLWTGFQKWYRVLLCGFLLSLLIECLQLFSYRATDIDDLLMNTTGAIVGYILYLVVKRLAPKITTCAVNAEKHWKWEPYCCFALPFLEMMFIQSHFPVLRVMGLVFR